MVPSLHHSSPPLLTVTARLLQLWGLLFWGCLEQAHRPVVWQGHLLPLVKTLGHSPCCFCPSPHLPWRYEVHMCAYMCTRVGRVTRED